MCWGSWCAEAHSSDVGEVRAPWFLVDGAHIELGVLGVFGCVDCIEVNNW